MENYFDERLKEQHLEEQDGVELMVLPEREAGAVYYMGIDPIEADTDLEYGAIAVVKVNGPTDSLEAEGNQLAYMVSVPIKDFDKAVKRVKEHYKPVKLWGEPDASNR